MKIVWTTLFVVMGIFSFTLVQIISGSDGSAENFLQVRV